MTVLDRIIRFSLERKLVVLLLGALAVLWGVVVAPFDWDTGALPRDPVPVDAIPDTGENQQIVFTKWPGRSPQDVEDQLTYPLTTQLLGVASVKTVRSQSMFGFSSIYVIFKEGVDFHWSRTRILEKLGSLPAGILPAGVRPTLGPDATALGQIFWYTLEGRDRRLLPAGAWEILERQRELDRPGGGRPAGGWDLHELRSIQDWYVRYALMSVQGVAEVASIGGFVQEYQVDIDPNALRAHRVTLHQVINAVRQSNRDVGARTIEVNRVEYVVRGLGFLRSISDLEHSVIRVQGNVPIYIKDVAKVSLGPAQRRGALDKGGVEAVGGVVVARHGANPLQVIKSIKKKLRELGPGLPKKTLADGTVSQVSVVPFYDRSGLIQETLQTLNTALTDEILVTIIVVLLLLMHLQSSLLISGLLPAAVLMTFIAMKGFGVDANVVALSGIAIAIGTMVDMGIVMTENIVRHLDRAPPEADRLEVVYEGSREVGGAVLTAVATTVISFLPVFTLQGAEGKLFRPLAFTKTFALLASVMVAILLIPPLAHLFFTRISWRRWLRFGIFGGLAIFGCVATFALPFWWFGLIITTFSAWALVRPVVPEKARRWIIRGANIAAAAALVVILAAHWLPLGPEKGLVRNALLVALLIGGVLGVFYLFLRAYPTILAWCLDHKVVFLTIPLLIVLLGLTIWLGFGRVFGWLPASSRQHDVSQRLAKKYPGLGKEFMPPLDEGSFLLMPTTMPHASIGEAMDIMRKQDLAISAIPEVHQAVGKLGRAESALDPAPVSMIETIITYRPKYLQDALGNRLTYAFNASKKDLFRDRHGKPLPAPDGLPYYVQGMFSRDSRNRLIPDADGQPFRLWRPALDPARNKGRRAWAGIQNPRDIWQQIVHAAQVPGVTSAPPLQPIEARRVMLQTGMRAALGVKIKGPDLKTIERVGLEIERLLKQVDAIDPSTVVADRIIGKPYLEIRIDRQAIARHGIRIDQVQRVIEVAIGGRRLTSTVEGRARYPVRVRYQRELRDSVEALGGILVSAPGGSQIPLRQLAKIVYTRGPQSIKSEDTFKVAYVTFNKRDGVAEVAAVTKAQAFLERKRASGELVIPPGVSYSFSGTFEHQVRAEKRLWLILPVALILIFIILYLQFRSVALTVLTFSGIAVAWAGGFLLLGLYSRPDFLDVSVFGTNLRELFGVHPIHLSVAVWVGFLALFGIATDDGVVMGTYLKQRFARTTPVSVADIRQATLEAGRRRVRAALLTTATTILALLPVLTSTGRGSDIMVPMAIPTVGGMLVAVITVLVVPVGFSAVQEFQLKHGLGPYAAKASPGDPDDQQLDLGLET